MSITTTPFGTVVPEIWPLWQKLEIDASRSQTMLAWERSSGRAFPVVRRMLFPTEYRTQVWPNPAGPGDSWLDVMEYKGQYEVWNEDRQPVAVLPEESVVIYELSMERLRSTLARAFGMTPSTDPLEKYPKLIPTGTYTISPGHDCPVYTILTSGSKDFLFWISDLLLRSRSPSIVFSGTRMSWPSDLRNSLYDKKMLLFPLSEALECCEDGFSPTAAWDSAMDSFRRMLFPENVRVVPDYEFVRRGGWHLRYDGRSTVLPGDLLGVLYIHRLISRPHHEHHVTELQAELVGDGPARPASGGQEILDQDAKREYKRRLEELASDRVEAERTGDAGRLTQIQREVELIAAELEGATGLGGRDRRMGDDAQNIRRRIAKNINEVIGRIHESDPSFAQHLRNSIRTGTTMSYCPDREIHWNL